MKLLFSFLITFMFLFTQEEHKIIEDADVVISFKIIKIDESGVIYYRSVASYLDGTEYQIYYPTVINNICTSGVQDWNPVPYEPEFKSDQRKY